jgi:hypothetical protein
MPDPLTLSRLPHTLSLTHTHTHMRAGNGGNAAAHAIHEECEAQGVVCSVIGVPKSIDNDILLVRPARGGEIERKRGWG